MKSQKIKNTAFTECSKKIFMLGMSLACFLLSIIYQSRAGYIRLGINNNFAVMTTFVLAVLNAFNLYEYAHACSGRKNDFSFFDVIEFISYILFSSGFFNVVLIPISGFGFMEIIIALVYLAGSTLTQGMKTKKVRFTGPEPFSTLIFGLLLLVLKCFLFYFMEDNMYLQFVEGNTILRFLIFFLSIACVIGIVRHISKIGEANLDVRGKKNRRDSVRKFVVKAWKALVSAVKKTVTFILSFFTGWIGIVIIVVIALLVLGIGMFAFDSFFNAVMKVVEPLLEKFLSTGEYTVNPGILYTAAQLFSLVIYTLFIFIFTKSSDAGVEKMCGELLENYVLNQNDFACYDRLFLKESAVKEICTEKNELKKIALASDKDEIEKIVRNIAASTNEKNQE